MSNLNRDGAFYSGYSPTWLVPRLNSSRSVHKLGQALRRHRVSSPMFKTTNFSLFDIKVNSQYKDLILIKGNELECEPIPFSGSIKLSVPEDTHIKRIKLQLVGEFNLSCISRLKETNQVDTIIEKLCVLKILWNNLLTKQFGDVLHGNYGDVPIPYLKADSLKSKDVPSSSHPSSPFRPRFFKSHLAPIGVLPKKLTKSVDGTPFDGVYSNHNQSFFIPKGNYNIPFSTILPTNILETIEGLNSGNILYKLQCSIEKGRFEKVYTKSKHIRIVRTLHPQSMCLIDSTNIENTWIGKFQYNVLLPRKGIAIGCNIPINFKFIPLVKGLILHSIKAQIHQTHIFEIFGLKTQEFETIIGKQELDWTSQQNLDEDNYDIWIVKSILNVPNRLKNFNQSCDLSNNLIKVIHKIKLSIIILNLDGHKSEIKANLPIWVYISVNAGNVIGKHFEIDQDYGFFDEIPGKDDILFKNSNTRINSVEQTLESQIELDREHQAPPLYNNHTNDIIFDFETSPQEQIIRNQSLDEYRGYFDIPKHQSKPYSSPPLKILNQVPSYEQALDEDESVELAPEYPDIFEYREFSDISKPVRDFDLTQTKDERK